MTFQIQISRYFRENILEIRKRVGISCSHEDLSLVLEILWVGMSQCRACALPTQGHKFDSQCLPPQNTKTKNL